MIIVYTLENCLHCEEIKSKLTACGYEYEERDMSTAENLTELKILGCFAREAPVIQVDEKCFEYCQCKEDNFFSTLFSVRADNTTEIPEFKETHYKLGQN